MEGFPISNSRHNLPTQLLPIIGREKEIDDLINLLKKPEIRLITLHGFGGSGKTRLAVEIGRLESESFTDGVWFVALAPINSTEHLLTAMASALRFDYGSSVDHKKQLFSYLQEKDLLLIFDNIEHLLPDAGFFLEELLQNTYQIRILVTSRQPLNMPWEWAYPLRGLEYEQVTSGQEQHTPAAVELFLQHLRRGGRTVESGDLACAARISRLVNGLPLALLLAANWGRTLGCDEIFTEIQRSSGFLKVRGQASSDKHSSLQDVFDYSWKLLSDHEQAALRKLSVFRGSFDRTAASVVTGADLSIIATLVDQALIERVESNRYQIHELLRQYLHDRLVEAGEYHVTHDAHLDYYTNLAKRAEPELLREQQYQWIDRLKLEMDNIGAAQEWSLENPEPVRLKMGIEMLTATERLWTLPLLTKIGTGFLRQSLASFPIDRFPQTYTRGLNLAAWLAYLLEDLPASRQYTAQALQIGLGLNDHWLVADTYYVQSLEAFYRKDYEVGQSYAQQALTGYQEINYEPGMARALDSLGRCESYSGNSSAAMQHITAAMDLAKKLGDVRTQYSTLRALGEVTGRDSQKLPQSRAYLQEALKYAREFNDKFYTGHILNNLGEIEREEGRLEEAIPYYEEAIAIEKELGRQDELIIDEANIAFVYCRLGQYDQARVIFLKNLALALKSDHLELEITTGLLGMATIAVGEGEVTLAAKALGSIDATKEPLLFWATDRGEYERTSAAAKALLGDQQFARLFREGEAMSVAQAAQIFLDPQSKESTRKVELLNSLTKREIEVLRLVAQGLSDAQVAERLVLSPRTVNAHLTSVYNKLGVNSRAAATRFAIDHGLA
jgi:predicted ATPase/DNA-binding CsgD family transcriptional regulator